MNKKILAFIVLSFAISKFCHVLKIFYLLYLDATASSSSACRLDDIWLNSANSATRITAHSHSACETDCLNRPTDECVGWTFWASNHCDIFDDLAPADYWKFEANAISGIRNLADCLASASKL